MVSYSGGLASRKKDAALRLWEAALSDLTSPSEILGRQETVQRSFDLVRDRDSFTLLSMTDLCLAVTFSVL